MSASRLTLRVFGETLEVEASLPDVHGSADAALPFLHRVTDAVVDASARHATSGRETVFAPSAAPARSAAPGSSAGPRAISCARGCSACCRRQPVPVAPPEVLALLRLVDAQPEPRRATLRARFRECARRIEEAGLRSRLLHETPSTPAEAREIVRRYLALELACPFLEDDACSIYADRPLACRLYLVTSPAALCVAPLDQPIAQVAVPMRPLGALLDALEALGVERPHTVPLALALAWAEAHRDTLLRPLDPAGLVHEWVDHLDRRPASS